MAVGVTRHQSAGKARIVLGDIDLVTGNQLVMPCLYLVEDGIYVCGSHLGLPMPQIIGFGIYRHRSAGPRRQIFQQLDAGAA
jgi:hypothetical protein